MVPPDSGTQGSGFWITSETFPLANTRTVKLLLASGGHASSSSGDGVLVRAGGDDDQEGEHGNRAGGLPDKFVYDPRNPVPTKGGDMCCINDLLPSGAFDQSRDREARRRPGVHEPRADEEHDRHRTGQREAVGDHLGPDTDFTAKLVDVHPDGYAQNILDRLVRARYRGGSKFPPSFIEREGVRVLDRAGQHSTVFKAGHKIRLEISSSNSRTTCATRTPGGRGIEHPDADSSADHPARRRPPVASGAAGRPESASRSQVAGPRRQRPRFPGQCAPDPGAACMDGARP